jgi:hypothetical protein
MINILFHKSNGVQGRCDGLSLTVSLNKYF